jgi:hypothetical protein
VNRDGQLSCMGVTASAVRALTDAERADLVQERRGLVWRATLVALSVPVTFVGVLVAAVVIVQRLPAPVRLLPIFLAMAAVVGVGVLALKALDFLRRRRRIAADLRRGEVACFEGNARAAVSDRTRILLAREHFPVDGAMSVTFESLCGTGRLWSVGGVRSRSWMLFPLQTPAAVPEHATVAANWVKPIASQGAATLLARMRPLSTDERAEIAGLLRRSLRRTMREGAWVAVTLALLLPGSLRARSIAGLRLAGATICALVLVRFGRKVVRDVRLARALSRDRAVGLVQIVRTREAKDAEMSPATEILPTSRVAWTRGGEPVPWRRGSGAEIGRG